MKQLGHLRKRMCEPGVGFDQFTCLGRLLLLEGELCCELDEARSRGADDLAEVAGVFDLAVD